MTKGSSGVHRVVQCKHCKKDPFPYRGVDAGIKHLASCTAFNSLQNPPVNLLLLNSLKKDMTQTPSVSTSKTSSVLTLARKLVEELPKFDVPITVEAGNKFRKDLIEVMADRKWSFADIVNEKVKDIICRWNYNLRDYYPSRREIHNIMIQSVTEIENKMSTKLSDIENCAVCLSIDGWTSVKQTHLIGVVVSSRDSLFSTSYQYSGFSQTGVVSARTIEVVMEDISKRLNTKISNLITDNAANYKKARNLLAARYPNVLMLQCFAHQINLLTQKLLKLCDYEVLEQVRKLIAKIRNSYRYTYIYRQYCKHFYGREDGCSLHKIGMTRWNSAHRSLCSLLRCRNAVKKTCNWILKNEKVPKKQKTDFENLFTLDKDFFTDCERMEFLLRPLVIASLTMQRRQATIAEVVQTFLLIYEYFNKVGDTQLRELLLMDLESRWEQVEQPLFLLAFSLHPGYCGRFQKMLPYLKKAFNLGTSVWAIYCINYYQKFVEGTCDEEALLGSFMDWLGIKGYRMTSSTTWPSEPVLFWRVVGDEFPLLCRLASYLLSCKVQSADCERLFSAYGLIMTPSKNRMKHETLVRLGTINTQLQSEKKSIREYKMLSPTEYPIKLNQSDLLFSFSERDIATIEVSQASSVPIVDEWLENNRGAASAMDLEVEDSAAQSDSDSEIDLPSKVSLKMVWESLFEETEDDESTFSADSSNTEVDVSKEPANLDFAGEGYRAAHPVIDDRSEIEKIPMWRNRKMRLKEVYECWEGSKEERNDETVDYPQVKRKEPEEIPQPSVSSKQAIGGKRSKRRGRGRQK